jgi:hypothetical protein
VDARPGQTVRLSLLHFVKGVRIGTKDRIYTFSRQIAYIS